jgi:uncharacterized membrane protein YcaP (DUF421 family)
MRAVEVIGAFIVLLIFLKTFGMNYQLRRMTTFDLIVNLILGAVLSGFLMNDHITTRHFIAIMALCMAVVAFVNMIARRTNWGRRMILGEPVVVIREGSVLETGLARANMDVHQLAIALREEKIHSLREIKMAQIEPGGDFTVIRRGAAAFSRVIIDNGVLDTAALAESRRTEKWLKTELRTRKISDISDVFMATMDRGKLYVIKKS